MDLKSVPRDVEHASIARFLRIPSLDQALIEQRQVRPGIIRETICREVCAKFVLHDRIDVVAARSDKTLKAVPYLVPFEDFVIYHFLVPSERRFVMFVHFGFVPIYARLWLPMFVNET